MVRRLFKVVHADGQTVGYYDSKSVAKADRDELNCARGGACRVSRGPDHWRGESAAR